MSLSDKITRSRTARGWPFTVAGLAVATAAIAGSAVYGYGETRAEAARDAERNVKQESQSRFGRSDCYTPVLPNDCKNDGNGWVCIAYVANHEGSCGNRTERRGELPGDGAVSPPPRGGSGGSSPPPLPGEQLEVAWFVTRVDEGRDVEFVGPLRLSASQAKAKKAQLEGVARQRHGQNAKVVLGITNAGYTCGFLFQLAGSPRYGFSSNTTATANDQRAREVRQGGGRIVSGPACRS